MWSIQHVLRFFFLIRTSTLNSHFNEPSHRSYTWRKIQLRISIDSVRGVLLKYNAWFQFHMKLEFVWKRKIRSSIPRGKCRGSLPKLEKKEQMTSRSTRSFQRINAIRSFSPHTISNSLRAHGCKTKRNIIFLIIKQWMDVKNLMPYNFCALNLLNLANERRKKVFIHITHVCSHHSILDPIMPYA